MPFKEPTRGASTRHTIVVRWPKDPQKRRRLRAALNALARKYGIRVVTARARRRRKT
ncbi:MAG: hypothetical protein L0027_17175 [Candidatus Rokubacteria bacterium]|nr:hypothetical protein [Candidatus Rokubacteria bacterium]